MDTLREVYRGRVVVQDVSLRGESSALQLPGQCERHQLVITFPVVLRQGLQTFISEKIELRNESLQALPDAH